MRRNIKWYKCVYIKHDPLLSTVRQSGEGLREVLYNSGRTMKERMFVG